MSKLVMTRSGVAVIWNAPIKPYQILWKVKILAGPELKRKRVTVERKCC